MFDVAVEQIVKVKPPKTAVVYKALLIIGCIVAANHTTDKNIWNNCACIICGDDIFGIPVL